MAVAQQEDLKVLEQLLLERLQLEVPSGDDLKIGCAISDGTLVVLTQHPPGVNLDSEKIFALLQQALQSLRPQVTQSVKLYLRVAGQKQTYAKYEFILQPIRLTTKTDALKANPEEGKTEDSNRNIIGAVHPASVWDSSEDDEFNRGNLLQSPQVKESSRPWQLPQLQIPTPILIIGGGVVLAALFSSAYVLFQPCVVGGCRPLQTAQQLKGAATHVMHKADSEADLIVAQQQLAEANNSLKRIPSWSSRYHAANQLSQTLLTQSATLEQVIIALQQASAAAKKGQQSHNVQEWQAIQAMWQRAIATLKAVPSNSALSPLAQQKVSEYQASLQLVNQQLNLELEASKKLMQAKNTAILAAKRQASAQSSQWQQVKALWQLAINTLASIPKNSIAYKEAQQLLETYRPHLAAVSDRTSIEQQAVQAFSQAISSARLAERDEQQQKFTRAIANWKQALTFAKQVPSKTIYAQQAQAMIVSYSAAMQQAQAKLKVANVLQKAQADLNRTCSGDVRVCNYTISNQLILVQLTPNYEQVVERSYGNAKRDDWQTQADVAVHYRTLRQALEAISDNAGIPLQVHEADGSTLHSYVPKS